MSGLKEEDRKVLLNTLRLDSFLKEFSKYNEEEKRLCLNRIERKCMDELVEFVSWAVRFEGENAV